MFRVVGEGPRLRGRTSSSSRHRKARGYSAVSLSARCVRVNLRTRARAETLPRVLSGFIAPPCEALDRARYGSRAARRSPSSVIEEFAISPQNYSRINWSSGGVFLFPERVPLTRAFSRLKDWDIDRVEIEKCCSPEFFLFGIRIRQKYIQCVEYYISFSCNN